MSSKPNPLHTRRRASRRTFSIAIEGSIVGPSLNRRTTLMADSTAAVPCGRTGSRAGDWWERRRTSFRKMLFGTSILSPHSPEEEPRRSDADGGPAAGAAAAVASGG